MGNMEHEKNLKHQDEISKNKEGTKNRMTKQVKGDKIKI